MFKSILFIALGTASVQAGLSRLEALSMIESGNNDAAIGQVGEVSRYQIQPWIWRQYSTLGEYQNPELASRVAEKHLTVLEQLFRRRVKRELDDFDLYVLWNAGPSYYSRIGFSKSRVHPVIRGRAQRYANLREAKDAKAAPTDLARHVAKPLEQPPSAPPALPVKSEPLWPVFAVQPTGLQNPMFSILPLTTQPAPFDLGQQSLFAIGGIKPQ